MATADEWLHRIAKLRTHRENAPHKPLLLLVLLEMAEKRELPVKLLPLTPELAFRFYSYWKIVAHRRSQRPDVRYPFHYLQSDGFWTSLAEDGKPSPNDRLTRFAELASDFVECAKQPAWREKARRLLIAKYFEPRERVALYTLVGLPVPSKDQIARDAKAPTEARREGREARFRLTVVAAYDYACALTGYQLTTITAGSIVDAAHIHQFSDSRNNDPRNGLALCKNAHWLFDHGLWSLTDNYSVIVAAGKFTEHNPDQKALRDYHGQRIRLPSDSVLWPNPVCLAWHRKHRFQGH